MSRRDDPYADDVHDTPDDLQDRYGDRDDADSPFPYPTVPFGWPANVFGSGPDDDYAYGRDRDDTSYDRETPDRRKTRRDVRGRGTRDEDLVDDRLVGIVLVVGLALFLFPEPVTSAVGVLLLAVGVGAWVVDALA
jgi:hypothetical protein